MTTPPATSLRRALALLEALGSEEAARAGGFGVSRLAQRVGIDKSQASRSLAVLAEQGFVDRDAATRAYRLGWRVFALAARAGDARLRQLAEPLLARLMAELGETVYLVVRQGAQALTVAAEHPDQAVRVQGWVGRTVPAAPTASGRALLFDHDDEALGRLLAQTIWPTHVSAPAPDELIARTRAERERGWAASHEEFEEGMAAVAAPVRDVDGRIVAALNVSGPAFRLGTRLEAAGVAVRAAADELSGRLAS